MKQDTLNFGITLQRGSDQRSIAAANIGQNLD
jgi:hypothetical protein